MTPREKRSERDRTCVLSDVVNIPEIVHGETFFICIKRVLYFVVALCPLRVIKQFNIIFSFEMLKANIRTIRFRCHDKDTVRSQAKFTRLKKSRMYPWISQCTSWKRRAVKKKKRIISSMLFWVDVSVYQLKFARFRVKCSGLKYYKKSFFCTVFRSEITTIVVFALISSTTVLFENKRQQSISRVFLRHLTCLDVPNFNCY